MDSICAKELEVWGLLYTKNLLDRELDFLKGNRLLGLSSPAVASLVNLTHLPSSVADLEHTLTFCLISTPYDFFS
ncbi:hypothetical protein MKW98_021151 [Papaver atlanticum]|uniref:Uncharacterized protein n=1 Tax=Papaver atlanticum TaxID=357466 RepID=A0AAD4TB87_9MAGN|nr:hypothetical protein MKW98_021151 [Papaver atlanticum]